MNETEVVPAIDFPTFDGDTPFKIDFPKFLNFLLQFAPEVPEERELRAKFAKIGIGPGIPSDFSKLSEAQKAEPGLGVKEGHDAIKKRDWKSD